MLFGLTSTDVPTFLQVAAVVTAVAAIACIAPALRATRTGAVLSQQDN